jgi:hypothetical protein
LDAGYSELMVGQPEVGSRIFRIDEETSRI